MRRSARAAAASLPSGARIGVIGCGTMGMGLLRGLFAARVVTPTQVAGYDLRHAQQIALQQMRVPVAASNVALARTRNVLVLAIKPQEAPSVLREIAPWLAPRHLLISIVAGVSTATIERVVGEQIPVVRVMPNAPAQVGQGIAVLCRGRAAGPAHLATATTLFGALGETLTLPERLFHAVTAISGSGPAYLFFLMETMLDVGRRLGIPPAALTRLVQQTVLGSARLVEATGESPAVWRARVTSKGGTTVAALDVFRQAKVRPGISRGIMAAARRSVHLGKDLVI